MRNLLLGTATAALLSCSQGGSAGMKGDPGAPGIPGAAGATGATGAAAPPGTRLSLVDATGSIIGPVAASGPGFFFDANGIIWAIDSETCAITPSSQEQVFFPEPDCRGAGFEQGGAGPRYSVSRTGTAVGTWTRDDVTPATVFTYQSTYSTGACTNGTGPLYFQGVLTSSMIAVDAPDAGCIPPIHLEMR